MAYSIIIINAMAWDFLFILRETKMNMIAFMSLLLHLYTSSEFSVRIGHKIIKSRTSGVSAIPYFRYIWIKVYTKRGLRIDLMSPKLAYS